MCCSSGQFGIDAFFSSIPTSSLIKHTHHAEFDIWGYISLLDECRGIRLLLQTTFWLLVLTALTQLNAGKKYLYSTFSITYHILD